MFNAHSPNSQPRTTLCPSKRGTQYTACVPRQRRRQENKGQQVASQEKKKRQTCFLAPQTPAHPQSCWALLQLCCSFLPQTNPHHRAGILETGWNEHNQKPRSSILLSPYLESPAETSCLLRPGRRAWLPSLPPMRCSSIWTNMEELRVPSLLLPNFSFSLF